jgi:hypothetical protein|tara:strand:+ start:1334 stop:1594 length:261 start_codon:yes stop_codon:yes gene_type:complete
MDSIYLVNLNNNRGGETRPVKGVNKMSKTLDRLVKKDPRIQSYYFDVDGYWVNLSDGYNWCGCGTIHEDTVKEVLEQVKYIAEGEE